MEVLNTIATLHKERRAVQSTCEHSWKPRTISDCKIYQCVTCHKITQHITETEN